MEPAAARPRISRRSLILEMSSWVFLGNGNSLRLSLHGLCQAICTYPSIWPLTTYVIDHAALRPAVPGKWLYAPTSRNGRLLPMDPSNQPGARRRWHARAVHVIECVPGIQA